MTSVKSKRRTPKIIGLHEQIDIPLADIQNLPCKIDTGAQTSSIHCEKVKIKEIDGVEHLCYKLLDKRHPLYSNKEISTTVFKEKKVRSSFGDYEFRYQVTLPIVLGGKKYKSKFTLSNRKRMQFPVLLGTQFLRRKFIVDVSQKNLLSNPE